MTRKPNRAVLSLLLLLVATLATALLVGVGRHWLTGAAPGVEPVSQQVRSLFGSIAIFTVGGLPAAITTWLLARRGTRVSVGRVVASAAIGNAVSAILGLGVLSLLIWETSDWLLTVLSLASLGFASFVLVLLVARTASHSRAHARAQRAPNETTVAHLRDRFDAEARAYRLREVREEQGVTQKEPAKRMALTQPTISALESGDLDRSRLATLRAYVEALGGTVEITATFGERRVIL